MCVEQGSNAIEVTYGWKESIKRWRDEKNNEDRFLFSEAIKASITAAAINQYHGHSHNPYDFENISALFSFMLKSKQTMRG